jgi:glycosyltransferase involved in cell wall biosynthesis
MSSRPRLLFLCQTLPYPPDGGVWIRSYHVLRLLSRTFDVTALCFERTPMPGNPAADDVERSRRALGRFADVEVFRIPQLHSRLRYAWDHFRSLVARRVYTSYLFDSRPYRRRLEQLVGERGFDLVHVDSLDLAGYLPACAGIPTVCVHHNVESALLRRRAAVERGALRRAYLAYQASLMEDVERRWCRGVALNVAVSEEDRARLRQIAPRAQVAVVPNGVDTEEFSPAGRPGQGVAFVGGTNWLPNRDALDFFCADILPHVRAARPSLPVRWIGCGSDEQRRWYQARCGVEVTGYVDDVRPLMREAMCHVVPLRAGGGTRLKILSAWALGKPVVSTSVGCEGLAAVDGDNLLIRDDPREFARAVLDVLDNEGLRRHLGERGRATAERFYSWEVIGADLNETYRTVANGRLRHVVSGVAPDATGYVHP